MTRTVTNNNYWKINIKNAKKNWENLWEITSLLELKLGRKTSKKWGFLLFIIIFNWIFFNYFNSPHSTQFLHSQNIPPLELISGFSIFFLKISTFVIMQQIFVYSPDKNFMTSLESEERERRVVRRESEQSAFIAQQIISLWQVFTQN